MLFCDRNKFIIKMIADYKRILDLTRLLTAIRYFIGVICIVTCVIFTKVNNFISVIKNNNRNYEKFLSALRLTILHNIYDLIKMHLFMIAIYLMLHKDCVDSFLYKYF